MSLEKFTDIVDDNVVIVNTSVFPRDWFLATYPHYEMPLEKSLRQYVPSHNIHIVRDMSHEDQCEIPWELGDFFIRSERYINDKYNEYLKQSGDTRKQL